MRLTQLLTTALLMLGSTSALAFVPAMPRERPPPKPIAKKKLVQAPAPPVSGSGPAIRQHTTATGLTVLVVENHALPLVTVEIAVKNGAMTEPPRFSGLSHLYEHMFFKANAVLPSQEAYMARVNELGIRFNGTTGTERVNYFFTTTTDHAADAMVFMRDAILTLKFDKKELAKERKVVIGEMDRAEANPFYLFGREVDSKVWFKHPTRKDGLGTRATVNTATPAMLKLIQSRYYMPNNSVLVVTGDVNANDIFAQADRLYAGWKRGSDPFRRYPLVTHPKLRKSEAVVMENDRVRTFIGRFVWHGPSTVPAEMRATYAADALGTYVSEPTSRFQRTLVESGLCLGAGLSWFTQRNVGPITLSYAAAPGKADECTKAIRAELKKLAEPGYITRDELAAAAYTLKVDKVKEREKPSALAHVLTFWWASASLNYYQTYVSRVGQVTPADVTNFITTYVKDKPYVYGALVSPEMVKAGLNKKHLSEVAGVSGGVK